MYLFLCWLVSPQKVQAVRLDSNEAQARGHRVRLQFKLDSSSSSSLYFLFCEMDGVCTGSCILFLCWLVSPQTVQAVRLDSNEAQARGHRVRLQFKLLDSSSSSLCIFYSARWMVCALVVVFCFYVGWFRHKRFRQIATRRNKEAQATGQRVRLQLLDSSSLYFLFCKRWMVCTLAVIFSILRERWMVCVLADAFCFCVGIATKGPGSEIA